MLLAMYNVAACVRVCLCACAVFLYSAWQRCTVLCYCLQYTVLQARCDTLWYPASLLISACAFTGLQIAVMAQPCRSGT
jgi:hypothetical protein